MFIVLGNVIGNKKNCLYHMLLVCADYIDIISECKLYYGHWKIVKRNNFVFRFFIVCLFFFLISSLWLDVDWTDYQPVQIAFWNQLYKQESYRLSMIYFTHCTPSHKYTDKEDNSIWVKSKKNWLGRKISI